MRGENIHLRSTHVEQKEIRQAFIQSAIHVVAQQGLVKATTKAIAAAAGLNEAYIYKCFRGKDELLAAALWKLDEGLARHIGETFPIMRDTALTWKERCFVLWKRSWKFILQKSDECIFYLRYYYSADFRASAREKHLQYYRTMTSRIGHVFRPGTDIDLITHQIFETMLSFAAHVMAGDMEDNDLTTERTFAQIYSFVAPHFRADLTAEEEKEPTV